MSEQTTPGLGPAGLKRFPTAQAVYAAVVAAATTDTHTSSGLQMSNDLATTLHGIVDRVGTELILPGSGVPPIKFMPLAPLQRQIRGLFPGTRGISAEVIRKCLEHAKLGPHQAVTMAKLVTDASGNTGLVLDLDRPLKPGEKFQWIVMRGYFVERGEVLQRTMYLPPLSSVMDLSPPNAVPRDDELRGELAAIARVWQPSAASQSAARTALQLITAITKQRLPGMGVTVEVFGSRRYGLCKSSSDIDLVMHLDPVYKRRPTDMAIIGPMLRNALRRMAEFGMVVWLGHARVPIIKFTFVHEGVEYEGDISFNNDLGPTKTRMLQAYMRVDPRVRPFMMLLKHWGDVRHITNSNVLNSFGLMMMGLAFLIDRRVVPPLQLLATLESTAHAPGYIPEVFAPGAPEVGAYSQHRCICSYDDLPEHNVDGHECYYFCDEDALDRWQSLSKTPVYALLYEMFRFYGTEFDPVTSAISPRLGMASVQRTVLSRLQAPAPAMCLARPNRWRSDLRLLAIEDPFEVAVNCGRNAPPEWVEGLLWEMRRGAWAMGESLRDGDGRLLARLFLPPMPHIYYNAGVWAMVFRRLLEQLQKSGTKHQPDPTSVLNLKLLENKNLA